MSYFGIKIEDSETTDLQATDGAILKFFLVLPHRHFDFLFRDLGRMIQWEGDRLATVASFEWERQRMPGP